MGVNKDMVETKDKVSACSGYACKRSCICKRYIIHCKAKEKGYKLKAQYVDAVVCVKHNYVNFIEV